MSKDSSVCAGQSQHERESPKHLDSHDSAFLVERIVNNLDASHRTINYRLARDIPYLARVLGMTRANLHMCPSILKISKRTLVVRKPIAHLQISQPRLSFPVNVMAPQLKLSRYDLVFEVFRNEYVYCGRAEGLLEWGKKEHEIEAV
jgi:hypothetical protein